MRKLILFVLLMMAMSGTIYAQEGDPSAPIDAVLWGADYFPYPEWQVYLDATSAQISSSWVRESDPPAVVFYNQQFGFDPYEGQELSEAVNDEWMDVIFIDYDGWQERNRCMSGSILLVEVDTVFNGAPYEARYWAYSNEAVFGSVFAAYPVEEAEQLEEMAAHFFPDSAVCAQG